MFETPLAAITADTLTALLTNGVREGRRIEYKQTLPGNTDSDKKEFLADVSSFANSDGGDLVYGVETEAGVATRIVGLGDADLDAIVLRLDNMIRDGLDPRLSTVAMRIIAVPGSGSVLLLRVARSVGGPHMVAFKDSSRFYARGAAGKYQMDHADLQAAFSGAAELPDRIRRWRDERLGRILASETPVALDGYARLVLHIVPLTIFSEPFRVSVLQLDRRFQEFAPFDGRYLDWRINLDGYLVYRPSGTAATQYCQVFRSGSVEAVHAGIATSGGAEQISGTWYEKAVMEATARHLAGLATIGVVPPLVVMVALLNVRGLHISGQTHGDTDRQPADRQHLVLPDVLLLSPPEDLPRQLRPIFDATWNAFGVPCSPNFDANHRWMLGQLAGVPVPAAAPK